MVSTVIVSRRAPRPQRGTQQIEYMGLLPDTQNYGYRMRRERRERFPATDFKGNR